MSAIKVAYAAVVLSASSVCPYFAQAAELGAAGRAEVEQLLSRLGSSECQFNRNGRWYTPTEARDHLHRKYQYALDKKLLSTPEDFIALAGSKSSASGETYIVKCGSAKPPQPSADWLSAELRTLRGRPKSD